LAENTEAVTSDMVHELKLLAHQCKQMIAASWLIRRDTCRISLPAA